MRRVAWRVATQLQNRRVAWRVATQLPASLPDLSLFLCQSLEKLPIFTRMWLKTPPDGTWIHQMTTLWTVFTGMRCRLPHNRKKCQLNPSLTCKMTLNSLEFPHPRNFWPILSGVATAQAPRRIRTARLARPAPTARSASFLSNRSPPGVPATSDRNPLPS